MLSVFKDALTAMAAEVVGYRVHKGMKWGNPWKTGEMEVSEWKRRTHKKTLQRNVAREIRERRRSEYKF